MMSEPRRLVNGSVAHPVLLDDRGIPLPVGLGRTVGATDRLFGDIILHFEAEETGADARSPHRHEE